MKSKVPVELQLGRLSGPEFGPWSSDSSFQMTGAFQIMGPNHRHLRIISSGSDDEWEHVSVSLADRTPLWNEMCFVKDMFWDEEECVVQFHPPKSKYVNCHPYCLHLWKSVRMEIPLPHSEMVGPKSST